jgi:hypothetical protein
MGDESQQVGTVDGAVAKAGLPPIPMRVEAATADLHYPALQAFRGQGYRANLPGDCSRVVKGVIKTA